MDVPLKRLRYYRKETIYGEVILSRYGVMLSGPIDLKKKMLL